MIPAHIRTWKHNEYVDEYTASQILQLKPEFLLDVGAGDGFWGKVVRHLLPTCRTTAVELNPAWSSVLEDIYDFVRIEDVKNTDLTGFDLIIFGDVLEHLEKSGAMSVLSKALESVKHVIVNGPVGFQPQEHKDLEEIHRCGIERSDFNPYKVLEYNTDGQMMNCLMCQ